jgi:hypothetical protein
MALDAGEDGISAAEIHKRLRGDPAFRTATAEWWEKTSKPDTSDVFDVERAGRTRIGKYVSNMLRSEMLENAGGQRGRYKANPERPPKNWRYRIAGGWIDHDIAADAKAAANHVKRIALIQELEAELAKKAPRALRSLAGEALQILKQRRDG